MISTEGEELSDLAAGPSHKLEAATPRAREVTDWRRWVERTLRRLQHLAELIPRMGTSGEGTPSQGARQRIAPDTRPCEEDCTTNDPDTRGG